MAGIIDPARAVTEPIGPGIAGQIAALTIDPTNPEVIYAGGDMFGIYRSTDGGVSWESFNEGLDNSDQAATGYVEDLLVLDSTSGVDPAWEGIYAATLGGMYFRELDGVSWTLLTDRDQYSYYGSDDLLTKLTSAAPIPFSTLAFDQGTQTLFAGAGHSRWDRNNNYMAYPIWPNYAPYESGYTDQYSLWTLDLSTQGTSWTPVTGTAQKGLVREIAVKRIDGETVVAFSSNTGIHLGWSSSSFATWENLAYVNKELPLGLGWSQEYWGLAFGADARLYSLQRVDALEEVSGVYYCDVQDDGALRSWQPLGDYDEPVEKAGRDSAEWTSWRAHVENTAEFDLTRLTVVEGVDPSLDTIYAGERNLALLGGFYINHDCGDGTRKWRHLIQVTGRWNDFTYHSLDPNQCDVVGNTFDTGWCDNTNINPTVELAIAPSDPSVMVAWMYHVPLRTIDGGASWLQAYCRSEDGGWRTNGLGEMSVTSFAFRQVDEIGQDFRLLIGAQDFALFEASSTANTAVRWLDRFAQERDFIDDVETYGGRITAVRRLSSTPPNYEVESKLIEYCDCADPGYVDLAHSSTPAFSAVYGGTKWRIQDHLIRDDGGIVLTVQVYGDPKWSDVWIGSQPNGDPPPPGEGWTWERWNTSPLDLNITAIILLPGRNQVLAASTSDGGGTGGVYALNLDEPGVYTKWLDPAWPEYGEYAKAVQTLATDAEGTVLYVGTYGLDHFKTSAMWRGGVLRCFGPFDSPPTQGDWEVIANGAGDNSFQIPDNPYHYANAGDAYRWGWDGDEQYLRPTDVKALVVDPNDPRIVYAGLNLPWLHQSNGVWRYKDDTWSQVFGGHTGGTLRGVSALAFDPLDDSRLYVGTDGEEVVAVDVPVQPAPPSQAVFTDRSEQVYQPGDPQNGIKYAGRPYSEVMLDYDLDGNEDLLVTQQDDFAVLYHREGESSTGDPSFVKTSHSVLDVLGFRGVAVADYDNDIDTEKGGRGYPDIFLSHFSSSRLLHNNSGAGFTDVTTTLGLTTLIQNSWCASWGDYDRDGRVDLFVGRAGGWAQDPMDPNANDLSGMPNVLLRNVSTSSVAQFEDVSAGMLTSPTDQYSATISASWRDATGDGELDLLVGDMGALANGGSPFGNRTALYINQGDGTFIDETASRLPLVNDYWIGGMSWADHGNDGDWDLLVGGLNITQLLHNDGAGDLTTSEIIVPDYAEEVSTVVSFDMDLDNLDDYLCIPHGEADSAVLLKVVNDGGQFTMQNVAAESGLVTHGGMLSAVVGDLTGDGDPEIVLGDVTKIDAATYGRFYYRNGNIYGGDQPLRGWFGVRLIGDGGTNKSAIGAVVEATIDGTTARKYVDGGSGLGGQQPGLLVFGASAVDKSLQIPITVIWPDGYRQPAIAQRNQVVEIYDDSAPGIVVGGFTAVAMALPDEKADWTFVWDTPFGSIPELDVVTVADTPRSPVQCQIGTVSLTPASAGVVHSVVPLPGGGYRHTLVWRNQPCTPLCSYDAVASSATLNPDGTYRTSATSQRRFTVSACIGGVPSQ